MASRATLHVRLLSIHIENQGLLFFFFFALGGAPSHRHVQYKVMCIIYIKEYHSIEEKRKKRLCAVLIYIDIAALDLEWIAANPSVSISLV